MRARANLHHAIRLFTLLFLAAGLAAVRGPVGAQEVLDTEGLTAEALATRGLAAFPGAEGYGALTPGGRGGRVIAVTTLADDGPGSLREALRTKGARIVVVRVGGVIELGSTIVVEHPFLTLAGQTAPGDGIVVSGAGIVLRTSDVIVRGMRFRVGDAPDGADPSVRGALDIVGGDRPARNIVVANNSMSWGIDELTSAYKAQDITFQWNIISESLTNSLHPKGDHGNAMLLAESAKRVSVHHNLIAHNSYRNPLIKGDTAIDFVNNVVYNWGHGAVIFEDGTNFGPTSSVIARNYFKRGPNSKTDNAVLIYKNTDDRSAIFVAGNAGDTKVRADLPLLADSSPLPAAPIPVSVEPVEELMASVLFGAGARSPVRDPIDLRVVGEVSSGKGRLIDSPSDVGGWKILEAWDAGSAPADSDGDGMPDSFETAHGLNPNDAADAKLLAPSGYTWVEEYLNSLVPSGTQRLIHLPIVR